MAWYDTGTIAVTNGNATVTGTGTQFISGAQVGEAMLIDNVLYEIQSIVSATSITLADNYLAATQSGLTYKIVPTQSLVADLSASVTSLISDYSTIANNAGAGKFNDGTVTSPGIQFLQDSDNGLYRIGSNNWGLVAGGAKIVDVSSTGIDVTGTATMDGLTVEGDINGPATNNLAIRSKYSATIDIDSDNNQTDRNFQVIHDGSKLILKAEESGDISFYEDTGTTAKFFWDASAESLGIGVSPIAPLHVKGTTDGNLLVRAASLAVGTLTGTALSSVNDAVSATTPLTFEASEFNFVQSNAVKVKVDSSGSVGIGTDSPTAPLTILSTGWEHLNLVSSDSN